MVAPWEGAPSQAHQGHCGCTLSYPGSIVFVCVCTAEGVAVPCRAPCSLGVFYSSSSSSSSSFLSPCSATTVTPVCAPCQVVGFGKSALDVACAAGVRGAQVVHVFRSPRYCIPLNMMGLHFDRCGAKPLANTAPTTTAAPTRPPDGHSPPVPCSLTPHPFTHPHPHPLDAPCTHAPLPSGSCFPGSALS